MRLLLIALEETAGLGVQVLVTNRGKQVSRLHSANIKANGICGKPEFGDSYRSIAQFMVA